MPLPNISVSLYPDVPDLPGVPPLLRAPGQSIVSAAVDLLTNDAIGVLTSIFTPVWGVFDDSGNPVAVADTVTALEYHSDSRISSYPQEEGAFGSFNKVQVPYASRVQMVCGGSSARRAAFLSAIEAAKQSTDLYTIISPDATYPNANVTGYDYSRQTKNGAALLYVNVRLEEVRENATASFANTQNPASADAVSLGQVQAQTPTTNLSTLYGPVSAVQ